MYIEMRMMPPISSIIILNSKSETEQKSTMQRDKEIMDHVKNLGESEFQDFSDKGIHLTIVSSTVIDMQKFDSLNVVPAEIQATALADPIPVDEDSSPVHAKMTTIPPTATPFVYPPAATLPAVSSSTLELRTTTVWIYASSSSTPSISSDATHNFSSTAHVHLPVFVIVLLAAGALVVATGAGVFLRYFLRHQHRYRLPTPSAPILQESPLFGGKERFSNRAAWLDPSFSEYVTPKNNVGLGTGKADGWRLLSGGNSMEINGISEKSELRTAVQVSSGNQALPVSPGSAYTAVTSTNVGLALDAPLPEVPVAVIKPLNIKEKGTEGKYTRRRSVTDQVYGIANRSSMAITESSTAYQTPRSIPTPGKPKPALKPSVPSRERVQVPYQRSIPAQTSSSSIPRRRSISRNNDESFMYAIPTVKSQERRDRDTKALTSALGLNSPPPPSSCFSPVSIYPDDSLSVVHGQLPSEMPSPLGTHAALGTLMLQDFPSVATIASLKTGDPFASAEVKKKSGPARNDKPPRVPSPPPLPSLAQMALANAEPDYKSPTYSIYGLYEAQRKSKASLGGDI